MGKQGAERTGALEEANFLIRSCYELTLLPLEWGIEICLHVTRWAWVLSTYPQSTGLSYSPLDENTCICHLVGLQEEHPSGGNGGKGLEVGAQCGCPRNRGGPLAGAQGLGSSGRRWGQRVVKTGSRAPPRPKFWLCSGRGEWEAMGVGRRDMIWLQLWKDRSVPFVEERCRERESEKSWMFSWLKGD